MHAFSWQLTDGDNNEVSIYLIDALLVRIDEAHGHKRQPQMILRDGIENARDAALRMTEALTRTGLRFTGSVYAAPLPDEWADTVHGYLDGQPTWFDVESLMMDLRGHWGRIT